MPFWGGDPQFLPSDSPGSSRRPDSTMDTTWCGNSHRHTLNLRLCHHCTCSGPLQTTSSWYRHNRTIHCCHLVQRKLRICPVNTVPERHSLQIRPVSCVCLCVRHQDAGPCHRRHYSSSTVDERVSSTVSSAHNLGETWLSLGVKSTVEAHGQCNERGDNCGWVFSSAWTVNFSVV